MNRFLLLPLLLLGFAATAQTTAPAGDSPRIGLNRSANSPAFATAIQATLTPLYIVDGYLLEATQLNDINPDRIESISVVKGDKALALYGEKGKGGVLLITTKPAKTSR